MPPHILGGQDGVDHHQSLNDGPDRRLFSRENDAGMIDIPGVQAQKIRVVGEDHSPFQCRQSEVLHVGGPQKPGLGHRQDIHSPNPESLGHSL